MTKNDKNPTSAIADLEASLQSKAAQLGVAVERTPHGLAIMPGHDTAEAIVESLAACLVDEQVVFVHASRPGGGLLAAFHIGAPQDARAYCLVSVGTVAFPALSDQRPAARSFWRALLTPYNTPAFFTVLGPEGVGKTTLCEGIEDAFNAYPLPLVQFHHTGAWKAQARGEQSATPTTTEKRAPKQESKSSLLRSLIRPIWRTLVPEALKLQIGAALGELTYMRNVVRLLSDAHARQAMVVADRYCYDRLVRWRNLKKPLFQRGASYLTCVFMRRPFHAFVLNDTPDRIFQRKQTMPKWEIELHQKHLVDVCGSFTRRYEVVDVSQLDGVEHVRATVMRKMFEKLGPGILDLIRLPKV